MKLLKMSKLPSKEMIISLRKQLAAILWSRWTTPSSETDIRPLAERISRQRPWSSANENWLAAERALRQKTLETIIDLL